MMGISATNGKIMAFHKRSVSVAQAHRKKVSLMKLMNNPLNLPLLKNESSVKHRISK